jgi:hypothetical protein
MRRAKSRVSTLRALQPRLRRSRQRARSSGKRPDRRSDRGRSWMEYRTELATSTPQLPQCSVARTGEPARRTAAASRPTREREAYGRGHHRLPRPSRSSGLDLLSCSSSGPAARWTPQAASASTTQWQSGSECSLPTVAVAMATPVLSAACRPGQGGGEYGGRRLVFACEAAADAVIAPPGAGAGRLMRIESRRVSGLVG